MTSQSRPLPARMKRKWKITERDCDLLMYLHAHKIATARQIGRDLFKCHRANVNRRLRKLVAMKLVTRLRHLNSVDSSDLFQLNAHAINFMISSLELHFMVKRFLSNSIDHDLMLIEIKSALLKRSIVKKFITENQLQTLPEYKEDDELERLIKLNPDGVIKLEKPNAKPIYLALEYEIHSKSQNRYHDKFGEQEYHTKGLPTLYVCSSKRVLSALHKVDKSRKTSENQRYYLLLENLLMSDADVTFESLAGKKLPLYSVTNQVTPILPKWPTVT